MKDIAEIEFEIIRAIHSKYISIATINLDKNKKLESVDIKLKPTIVVYVMDFTTGDGTHREAGGSQHNR